MLCFIPINTLALGTLAPDKLKNASGLYNLMRNLGGAIGLAALNTIMTERTALHWSRLADSVNAARPAVQEFIDASATQLGNSTAVSMRMLANLVERETQVLTFNDAMLLMSLVFAAALLLIPLVRKPKYAAAGAH
jgi:DHA2 family multidrug resistance protein